MFRPSIAARAAGLACAIGALALAGAAHAGALPSYFLTLTETATGLQVTSNLPTYDSYDPNVFYPDINPPTQSNNWRIGPQPSGFQEFSPTDGAPGSAIYNSIAWADPGTGNYNVLNFAPSGNLGDITFAAVSDVTAGGLFGFYNYGGFGTPNVNFHQSCLLAGAFADNCPILAAGATFVTPISVLFGTSQATLAVTYIDSDGLRDASGGVPEPAAWALMIVGLGLTGAALRRRRVLAIA
jgi:PEP-CTERM motif